MTGSVENLKSTEKMIQIKQLMDSLVVDDVAHATLIVTMSDGQQVTISSSTGSESVLSRLLQCLAASTA